MTDPAPPPIPSDLGVVGTGLADAPPPSTRPGPDERATYVRSAMHQDRSPGNLLVVLHPLRAYKLPRGLFDAIRDVGFEVKIVETHPDRVTSAAGIRDGLLEMSADGQPLDLMVVSGDGSLDHHVLVAAFWAFCPELVCRRDGEISCASLSDEERRRIPAPYRAAFFRDGVGTFDVDPDEDTIRQVWLLRALLEGSLQRGRSVGRLLRKADRAADDPILRLAVLAHFVPDRLTLRAHGFDLAGLAKASQRQGFQGLYPFIRSIAAYPAGTAADNALFAGVPGWTYAQASRFLVRFGFLDGLRQRMEERARRQFIRFFTGDSVVVPARFSLVAFDGDWQLISSHAAGGPAGGRFFSADLSSKTKGLLGYLLRIPKVVVLEAIFGSTFVRLKARTASGRIKTEVDAHMAEGLYTNRTFIAGVGSVPSTNPTSFAGRSTLAVVPPVWRRGPGGRRTVDLHGIATFFEGITKGLLGRALHGMGFSPGAFAGGGKFAMAEPQHQVTLEEGEEVDISFHWPDGRPRMVPLQVSGDPLEARQMAIRVAWGPLPMLAGQDSLMLGSAKRSLGQLRVEQAYRLEGLYIGGLHYFRHRMGAHWTPEFSQRTGLFSPPSFLPRRLARVQKVLTGLWQAVGAGEFIDTSEPGISLGDRGRYAHNNDHSAHLVIVREGKDALLVRQVRASQGGTHEARTSYRLFGRSWIVRQSQTRHWQPGEPPRILQEEHYFRTAEAFQHHAPTFFPVAKGLQDPIQLD